MGRGRPQKSRTSISSQNGVGGGAASGGAGGLGLPVSMEDFQAALAALREVPAVRDTDLYRWAVDTVASACLPLAAGQDPANLDALPPPPGIGGGRGGQAGQAPLVRPAKALGLHSMYDGAWNAVLDFLELPQVLRIRAVSRTISRRVQDCLTVLSLNGLEDMRRDWVNPASLSCLTRFKNVKTLHWYVGQVHSDEDEELTPRSMWWGESLMVWTYLLAHLKVDDVTITEGPKTDEQGLEGLWSHVLPACAPQLQRLAMSFEGYNDCLENEDHPPINLKKFSVMLAKEKPFPNLRELHMEMGSMSMNEQRSLVLGIGRSGLLARLEALTLGGGTSTYNRPPPKGGAGGELARLLQKQGAPQLRLLWIQRLDIWDDFDGFARVLNSPRCPALCELYLDLTLDCDDVGVLAQCLHLFPACLTTLGVLVVCIKSRTPTGEHEPCRPNLALHALANAMVAHPRENLQCLDLSLHVDPQNGVDSSDKDQDCIPILRALASGAAPKLRHLQLPNTYLERAGFDAFIEVLPSLKSLQTIDLSANTISVDGAQRLISALRSMPAVYEVVCEDCVSSIKDREEMEVLCSSLPSCHFLWKSVQETAAEEDLDDQSFSSNEDAPMMDADGVDEEGEEDEEEVDFAEGNGLVHAHPAPWWAVGGHDMAHDWDMNEHGEPMGSDGELPDELQESDSEVET